jgi:hypothetical protein
VSRWTSLRDLACFGSGVAVAGYGLFFAPEPHSLIVAVTGCALVGLPQFLHGRAEPAIEAAPEHRLRIRHRKQQDPIDALKPADREWLDRMLAYAELEVEPEPEVTAVTPVTEPPAIKGPDLTQWQKATEPKERLRAIVDEMEMLTRGITTGHTATIPGVDVTRFRALMREAEDCKWAIERERTEREIRAAVGVPPSIIGSAPSATSLWRAVVDWQRAHRVRADGRWGPESARVMRQCGCEACVRFAPYVDPRHESCSHLEYEAIRAPDGRVFPMCTRCGATPPRSGLPVKSEWR